MLEYLISRDAAMPDVHDHNKCSSSIGSHSSRMSTSNRADHGDTVAPRCFFTVLPPWLLPLDDSKSSGFRQLAVFVADPRFLIMRTAQTWEAMGNCIRESCKHCHDNRQLQGCAAHNFLETYLANEAHLVGEEMRRLSFWALEEDRQPGRVKLFFVEDFIADPNLALRGLARFLGVPEESEVVKTATQDHLDAKTFGLLYPRSGMLELQHILAVVRDFEEELAELNGSLQAAWEDKVALWLSLPNLRMASLAQHMQKHQFWVAPEWWIQHTAGLCRPCSFAVKDKCKNGDACIFCHSPSHRSELRRLSMKERLRMKRRESLSMRDRTPSPEGLSE